MDNETRKNLQQLEKYLLDGKTLVPFVGAGYSKQFGMPTWYEFLELVITYLEEMPSFANDDDDVKAVRSIKRRLARGELELAAQDLYELKPNVFERVIASEFKWKGQPDGDIPQLTSLAQNFILTTNFDDCLEGVLREARRSFEVLTPSKLSTNLSELINSDLALVKLHGSYGAANKKDRVLTEDQYKKHYCVRDSKKIDFGKSIPTLLQLVVATNIVLFVGCSLADERLLKVFKSVNRRFKIDYHFAIVPKPKEAAKYEKFRKLLDDCGIKPLWFSEGKYDEISVLLDHLVDARNRRLFRVTSWESVTHDDNFIAVAEHVFDRTRKGAVVRISCNADDYKQFSKHVSSHPRRLARLVWTLDGSPLLNTKHDETKEDVWFRETAAKKKTRIIIFNGKDEVEQYVNPEDTAVSRKEKFETNARQGKRHKLLYASKKSLSKLFDSSEYLDFGYVQMEDSGSSGLIFCSPFTSLSLGSADTIQEVLAFGSDNASIQASRTWTKKTYSSLNAIKRLVDSIKLDSYDETDSGVFDCIEELLEFEQAHA